MASQYSLAVLITICIALGACSAKNDSETAQAQTKRLSLALEKLDLSNPVADLDAALRAGDKRFVCVLGYGATAPGVSTKDEISLQSRGMRCIEGTSDALESDEHERLTGKAIAYARSYNLELMRRIRDGIVT
jgi:outer membrane lipoprotein LolB